MVLVARERVCECDFFRERATSASVRSRDKEDPTVRKGNEKLKIDQKFKTHFPAGTRTLRALSRRRNLRSCRQRVPAA